MTTIESELQSFRNAVHILNGDMLLHQLQALEPHAEYIVMRECLVEGEASNTTPAEFYRLRAQVLESTYGVTRSDYQLKTVQELERIQDIAPEREVMLWFENDLFCQTNLWFVSTLFDVSKEQKLFRVYPSAERSGWSTFSIQNSLELEQCFATRLAYNKQDLRTMQQCWAAYCANDSAYLLDIAKTNNPLFQHFDVLAELLEYRQFADICKSILAKKIKELPSFRLHYFSAIFADFQKLYPMYGFGDLQLKSMYETIVRG